LASILRTCSREHLGHVHVRRPSAMAADQVRVAVAWATCASHVTQVTDASPGPSPAL
jgi:hypothetical protein